MTTHLNICMYVRNEDCNGEDEPLNPELVKIMRQLQAAGWWPSDFGEMDATDHEGFTELWFIYGPDIAERQTDLFIAIDGWTS